MTALECVSKSSGSNDMTAPECVSKSSGSYDMTASVSHQESMI